MGAGDFLGSKWTLPRSDWEEVGVGVHPLMSQNSYFWGDIEMDSGNPLYRYITGHSHPSSRQKWKGCQGPGNGVLALAWQVLPNIKHE